MSGATNQITIRAGRVVCPTSGFDGPGTLVIHDDYIEELQAAGSEGGAFHGNAPAGRVFDFPNGILLPGLIDLHAHPAHQGSIFGVSPDQYMLPHGVTTVLSQGDVGADRIDDYLESTLHVSGTRVLLAVNLSRIGESTATGCFRNVEDADIDACVTAVDRHRKRVCAIAVNVSHHACARSNPREVLNRGLEAAAQTGLPLLYGMRRPDDWPLEDQLTRLRPGDIVTYCFRREPHCIVEAGRVLPAVRNARERGVLFDLGHGTASFCFEVAQAAVEDGFLPDTISTDFQKRHIGQQPHHSLTRVMSKLCSVGMPEADVFAAVTRVPAEILQLDTQIGSLAPGACADVVVLDTADHDILSDVYGRKKEAPSWSSRLVVRGGKIVEPNRRV